jgi:pyruvate/2-oxoglutarate dehydrogenase complex dihydrolipoamide dehydrogenase (E3) component
MLNFVKLSQEHVMSSKSRRQLVGRVGRASEQILSALAADLADAYAEIIPTIEVVFEPTLIKADIIIVAAGQTLSAKPAHLLDNLPDRLEGS